MGKPDKSVQISKLLKKGESETLEFKESFSRECLETLSAFANTRGGILLVGVHDKADVTGAPTDARELKNIANQIVQGTGLQPSIQSSSVGKKKIICIQVAESKIKPVQYHGRAYKRVGSTTRQMSMDELTRAVLARSGTTWDSLPERGASLDDISTRAVKMFMSLANETGRREISKKSTVAQVLQKLHLMRHGQLTRAAVLLFAKDPQKFYSQAVVRVGRFRSETIIVDDRMMSGTLFEQVAETLQYFRDKLETAFKMTGRPQREVIWEYPLEALREAVINAVCHRDYAGTAQIQIRLYDDRLSVWNPGGLPDELTISDLYKEHASIPHNSLIAEIFYYSDLIEQWGSGVAKIMSEAKSAGLPKPVFEEKAGFCVVFKKMQETQSSRLKSGVESGVELGVGSGVESGMAHNIFELLAKDKLGKREIALKLGKLKPTRYLNDLMNDMLKSGFVEYTIPEKPSSSRQKYHLTGKGRKFLKGN